MTRIAYLGPEGTFTEAALLQMAERELAHSFAEMVMATPPYRGARHLPPATT